MSKTKLYPEDKPKVYRFGVLWFWKCGKYQCGCGGRSRDWKSALTGALTHIHEDHFPA